MNFKRDPLGKFIGRGEALSSWLPSFLDWVWHHPLSSMLDVAAKWCDKQAQAEYRRAVAVFDQDFWVDPRDRARRFAADAQKWFQRRAVLLEAKDKLEEIR